MIAALLLLGASSAFAGDSDALKAVKKTKTYAEAEALVKQNLNAFANDKEKAAAYNHLVGLAIDFYNTQNNTMAANELAAKTGQKVQPVDTAAMYDAAYNALVDAVECAKYDNMPDEKGKVKPKFLQGILQSVTNVRLGLVNAGQWAATNRDTLGTVKYWGAVVDTKNSPFVDQQAEQQYSGGQVALWAGYYAGLLKQYDKANRYLDVAMQDPEWAKDALNTKVQLASENLKTHEDSVKFAANMEGIYRQHPESDAVFEQLANLYRSLGQDSKVDELLKEKFAKDPNNLSAWYLKGRLEEDKREYDKAIESFKKCISIKGDVVAVNYSLAAAIINKASLIDNVAQRKTLYQDAITYLEKARQLDPNQEQINWAYILYQCYYNVYGADDSRTKELETIAKQ